jgi:hypothetical protein
VITDTSGSADGSTYYAKVFYNDQDGDATRYTYSGGNQRGSGSVGSGSSGVIDQTLSNGCVAGVATKAQSVSFTVYDSKGNASNSVTFNLTCPSGG